MFCTFATSQFGFHMDKECPVSATASLLHFCFIISTVLWYYIPFSWIFPSYIVSFPLHASFLWCCPAFYLRFKLLAVEILFTCTYLLASVHLLPSYSCIDWYYHLFFSLLRFLLEAAFRGMYAKLLITAQFYHKDT